MLWICSRSNGAHNLLAFRLPDGGGTLTETMIILITLKVLEGSTELLLDNPSSSGGDAQKGSITFLVYTQEALSGQANINVRVR